MNKLYRFFYCLVWPFFNLFCPTFHKGRENIPDGPVMICVNHTSNADPVVLAYGLGIRSNPHFMAKVELLKKPIFGWLLKKIGVFGVDRGKSDIGAIKNALTLLKKGEQVAIFPQGTRVRPGMTVSAKSGAIRMASAAKAPILPVFVPEKKRLFRKNLVVIGEPYYIDPKSHRADHDEQNALAAELMSSIIRLGRENGAITFSWTDGGGEFE